MGKEDAVHTYTMEYYSVTNRSKTGLFVDLEHVMQSEVKKKTNLYNAYM